MTKQMPFKFKMFYVSHFGHTSKTTVQWVGLWKSFREYTLAREDMDEMNNMYRIVKKQGEGRR